MASSVMLRCVALVRADVSEEPSSYIISITRIGEVGTTLATTVGRCGFLFLFTAKFSSPPILVTLMMEVIHSSETSVLTMTIWRNITEDGILLSHRRENFKPLYIINRLGSVTEM
jgi:hypothetical protein